MCLFVLTWVLGLSKDCLQYTTEVVHSEQGVDLLVRINTSAVGTYLCLHSYNVVETVLPPLAFIAGPTGIDILIKMVLYSSSN